MGKTSTHFKVPLIDEDRRLCLGPDGSAAQVMRTMRMVHGRWKLPILFRLFAQPAMRTSQLRRDIPGVSQKMLTLHLRELESDHLVERIDFGERPPRVEYRLSKEGKKLLGVLLAARDFALGSPPRERDPEKLASGFDPMSGNRISKKTTLHRSAGVPIDTIRSDWYAESVVRIGTTDLCQGSKLSPVGDLRKNVLRQNTFRRNKF
jgi:DNA-binding HxlR family transcriptional regulator